MTAKDKFKIGDVVVASRESIDSNVFGRYGEPWRPGYPATITYVVTGYNNTNPDCIMVRRDGYKTSSLHHMDFFEVVPELKGLEEIND